MSAAPPPRPARPSWRRLAAPLLAVVAVLAATAGAAAALTSSSTPAGSIASLVTSSIAPVADASVRSDRPATNDGGSTSLAVDASPTRRSYVRFSLGLASKPTQVKLSLTALSKQSKGFVLHPSSSTWTESTLTWSNAPAASSKVCGRSGAVSAGQRVTIVVDTTACPVPATGSLSLMLDTPSRTNLALGSRESSAAPALLASTTSSTGTSTPTTTPTTSSPSPTSSPSAPASGAVTKLLVFVEENHSLSQMQSGMPYTFGLAKQYGYATAYKAITHPSLPNYLAIAGGSTFGVTDDSGPSSHPINASSVFGQAIARGKTAKTYADGMTSNCMKSGTGKYAVKHNPWPYFTPSSETVPCASYDVPETQLAGDITNGTLPNVGMVVPDLCNDAHDCSLSVADSWFQARMAKIFAGPDWKSGHLAVVLTADEDDSSSGNTVLTVVIHPSQKGHVVATPLTHYSLTKLYEDVTGASYLNNAASAPSMSSAFGLPMP